MSGFDSLNPCHISCSLSKLIHPGLSQSQFENCAVIPSYIHFELRSLVTSQNDLSTA